MKKCPNCQQIFDDDTIFCTNDGTTLIADSGQHRFGGFQRSGDMPTQYVQRPQNTPSPPTAPSNRWIFPLVGILCGLVVVLGFVAFFRESPSDKSVVAQKNTEAVESNKNTEARPSIQVEKTPVPPPPPQPSGNQPYPIVTVNSPRDGYLALKSDPCIAPCRTILKIPHGTRLSLGTCKDTFEVADRRRGRWCYVSYGGQTGWIFDAFVTY